jgi:hypothetical protein
MLSDPLKTLAQYQQFNNNNNQIGVQQFNQANSPLSQQQLLNHNKIFHNYMLSAITTMQNNNSPQNQATFHSLLKHLSNTMPPFIPRPSLIPPQPIPAGLLPQNNHQFLKHHFEYLMNQQKKQHIDDLSVKKNSENSSLSSELSSSSSSSTNSCPITSDYIYESNNQTGSSNLFNIDEIDNSTKNIINEIKEASKMRNCRKKIKKNSTPNKLEDEKITLKEEEEEEVEIDVDYVEDDDSLNDLCYNDQNENDQDHMNKLEPELTDEEDSEPNNEDENRKKKLSANNSSASPTPFMFSSMRHYSISNKSSSSASSISSVLSNGKDNSSCSIKPFKHSIDFILGMDESRQSKRKNDLESDDKSNNNLSEDEENYSLKKSN